MPKPAKKLGFCTLSALAIAISMFGADESWALCTAPSSPVNFPNPIITQRDTPVGAIVATATVRTTINCNGTGNNDAGQAWAIFLSSGNVDSGGSSIADVRATNIPGIGIRWTNHSDAAGTSTIWTIRGLNDTRNQRGIRENGLTVFTDTFELVKIGNITSTVSPNWVLDYAYRTANGTNKGKLYSNTATSQNMQVVACSVTNTSIPIDMGSVKTSEFPGQIGGTTREKNVIIPLDCDASTKVNITLDGTPHSSGAPGVLALTPSATQPVAGGVGLQLLYNSAAVTLGTPIAVGTTVSDGAYSILLIARYYQTAVPVTQGQANSTATFTMSYR